MIEDEKNNCVKATFELPGLQKEDVNIDLHNNRLTISGESKAESERQEGDWAVRERWVNDEYVFLLDARLLTSEFFSTETTASSLALSAWPLG